MKLLAATVAGTVLFMVSTGLLYAAREATDAIAIAGGTGLVLAGALLGLTCLAWRWRLAPRAYTATIVDNAGFYDELAEAFEQHEPAADYDDLAV